MDRSYSIHLVDKTLISCLYNTIEQQGIHLDDALIPADFFIDTKELYLPDTVFKYLVFKLYSELEPSRFIQVIESLIAHEIIPKVNQKLGTFSNLDGALRQHALAAQTIQSGSQLVITPIGDDIWLTRPTVTSKVWSESIDFFYILYLKNLVESFVGKTMALQKVAIGSSKEPQIIKQPYFEGCTLFLGRSSVGLSLDKTLLQTPINSKANKSLVIADHTQNSFLTRFRLALSPYINFGRLPIDVASELLDIEKRTLQRMLAKESTSYRAELDYLIFEKVKRLLRNTNFSVTDISYQFNYTDSSNFARAFKRYVGVSPHDYRARVTK